MKKLVVILTLVIVALTGWSILRDGKPNIVNIERGPTTIEEAQNALKSSEVRKIVPVVKSEAKLDKTQQVKLDGPQDKQGAPSVRINTRSTQDKYIAMFLEENVDPDWGYQYAESIQNELFEILNEKSAWIDSVECKKTICKLDISATANGESVGRTAARILGRLSAAEWHQGSHRIANLNSSDGKRSLEILVGRYDDTFR